MIHPNDKAVYVIRKSPFGGGQVVLHVTDTFRAGYLCYDDTNRGHMLRGEITESDEETFTFLRADGDEWMFEIVTIEKFNQEVHRYVCNGKAISNLCNSTEDLWEYYRKNFPL